MLNSDPVDSSIGLIACLGERRADGVCFAEEELRDSKSKSRRLCMVSWFVPKQLGFDLFLTSEVFIFILVVGRLQS